MQQFCINCASYRSDRSCTLISDKTTPLSNCDKHHFYRTDAKDTIMVQGQVLPLSEYEIGLELQELAESAVLGSPQEATFQEENV